MAKPTVSPDAVVGFLTTHHGAEITDVEPLPGGHWSAAFGYVVDGAELVLRVGDQLGGFRMDRAAARLFAHDDLPIPTVHHVGPGLGHHVAVSDRRHGRFIESVTSDEADVVGPTIVTLLRGLLDATPPEDLGVSWSDGAPTTWRDVIRGSVTDDPSHPNSGWRPGIAARRDIDRVYTAAIRRIDALLDACPERRDVVHADLYHGNVLVSHDASAVTAVISWKCSSLGDFAFDLAMSTFWTPWHHGIGAADPWSRLVSSLTSEGRSDALVDLADRHHCYELSVGAAHLGWYVFTGNDEELGRCAARIDEILERGPRRLS